LPSRPPTTTRRRLCSAHKHHRDRRAARAMLTQNKILYALAYETEFRYWQADDRYQTAEQVREQSDTGSKTRSTPWHLNTRSRAATLTASLLRPAMETISIIPHRYHHPPETSPLCLHNGCISSPNCPLTRGDSALLMEPSAKQVLTTIPQPKQQALAILQVRKNVALTGCTGSSMSPTRCIGLLGASSSVVCRNITDRLSMLDRQ
jgi:hypothetical protein